MAKGKGNGSAEGHRNAADINNPGPERVGSAKENRGGGPNMPGQGNSGLPEQDDSSSSNGKRVNKKDVAKAYEKYAQQFTPKPKYVMNSLKAFLVGGAICVASMYLENRFIASGMPEKEAAAYVVIILIMLAQLLTGLGWFDTIAKHVGAGVIVPITGFANSMVAPALEYKKEGAVLGVGQKLFSLAGPVLVCGITASMIIGVIYWLIGLL